MIRTDLIKLLGFVLGLQLIFAALHYFGGYEASPAITGGVTAGLLTTYFARKRRKQA
ncbi:hypothetical protein FAES_1533 [Fibrella aestuarina BUZ 2]|uniref:Uncharacterized protein n=1 Tax=Fibrella aestuarina BUZ 2 TaxID=1166018 RepID=I0K5Z0_9BACT|nr:hypothetical protein [Fibrella aestuarina]CCG99543.1 hypothetical protein FAES_1533 [Fibrella aestuarina BUZ 2]